MTIYSGYIEIETTGESAYYEFDSDEELDAMGQLNHMLNVGIIQIIDAIPRDDEDDEDF